MLTQEMFLALLQGLPAADLEFLDRAWYLMAVRIERGLKQGLEPPIALHDAMDNSSEWERNAYLHAYLQEDPVQALPDLSQAQKEALIVLRDAGTCSLAQLSRIVMRDRSNTRRTLGILVEKGYAVKYFRRTGPAYMAIISPLSEQHRSESIEIMQAFKQFLIERSGSNPASQSTRPTTTTTETIATKETTETTSTTATTPTTETKHTKPTTKDQPSRPP